MGFYARPFGVGIHLDPIAETENMKPAFSCNITLREGICYLCIGGAGETGHRKKGNV